jgi:hypothetical protein
MRIIAAAARHYRMLTPAEWPMQMPSKMARRGAPPKAFWREVAPVRVKKTRQKRTFEPSVLIFNRNRRLKARER